MAQPHKNKTFTIPSMEGVCLNCVGLKASFEALQANSQAELTYLRQMVKDLTDKLMCMTPELADRHHRLKLTELAQNRPEVMAGVIPMNQTIPESEEQAFNNWMNDLTGVKS